MQVSRRHFLTTSAAVASAPLIVSATAMGSPRRASANERMSVAMIGCGKMANDYHIPELLKQDDVQLVAVCEVDQTRREHALDRVRQHYSTDKHDFKGCDTYVDYREVIARQDIDAVCIATPDHWHAIPLIEACKAGKDVYCEKPLTLTIAEAKRCIDAARRAPARRADGQSAAIQCLRPVSPGRRDHSQRSAREDSQGDRRRRRPQRQMRPARGGFRTRFRLVHVVGTSAAATVQLHSQPTRRAQPLSSLAQLLRVFRRRTHGHGRAPLLTLRSGRWIWTVPDQ